MQNKRAVYAVVCETLKHQALLQPILEDSGLCQASPQVPFPFRPYIRNVCHIVLCFGCFIYDFLVQVTRAAALVLLYDHLVGQGVKPRGPVERMFLSYAAEFDKLRQKLLLQQPGAKKLSDLLENCKPACQPSHRTARVNLLLTNSAAVRAQLSEPCSSWAPEFQEPTPAEAIVFDEHLDDVFSLPTKVLAHNHPLVESGHVVLQARHSAQCLYCEVLPG